MSKRIMNEVMVIAEKEGARIHYQDTDSMHIESEGIEKTAQKFYETFHRPLIAAPHKKAEECLPFECPSEELGLFHSDFAPPPYFVSKFPNTDLKWSEPEAKRSYFIGKKIYLDIIEAENTRFPQEKVEYEHVRMKGVPLSAIESYEKEHNTSKEEIYKKLISGEEIEFDLTAGGKNACMLYKKNMAVINRAKFTRRIKVNAEHLGRSEKEFEQFFPMEETPYKRTKKE